MNTEQGRRGGRRSQDGSLLQNKVTLIGLALVVVIISGFTTKTLGLTWYGMSRPLAFLKASITCRMVNPEPVHRL